MKIIKKVILALSLLSLLAIYTPIFAQPPTGTGGSSTKLVNPLGGNNGIKKLDDLVEALLRITLTIGTPIIAIAIIYSGFLFIKAQGDPQALTEARQTLLYVIIGAGILLGAYVIAETIVGTVNAIRGQ